MMEMEEFFVRRDTVDPEVRAHVNSLVTALGGTSIEEHGRYVLGDDAIGCLKDLRRWLKFYDEKLSRLDVQRALAESNFVKGDVLEILADWPETGKDSKLRFKVSLLCLEMLVPLTWTLEIADDQFTAHHHRHLPYLKLAQVEYKRAILQHDSKKILRQIVRLCLPSMAEPRKERSIRDEGIIRLALYAIRNVAMITQPPDLPSDGDEVESSRSTTIDAFHYQEVFQLLLTIASSMGDEFTIQDVVILEVLFHLLKGIDPAKLFMKDDELTQTNTTALKELLRKEKAMLAGYARYAPTRHNRFGTMLWLKRDDERISTISGQSAISGPGKGLEYLDKAKKWNKPKTGKRNMEEKGNFEFDLEVPLTGTARSHLRKFVEDFLDTSFNPLFTHLRKSIERELDRVLEQHKTQYFFLVSWFLKAECARRVQAKHSAASKGKQKASIPVQGDEESFAIIAGAMDQETFILLHRFMQSGYDSKAWNEVNAGMKCFTQILQTIQQMEESANEEDQEIAENIQNRIFYEGTTHDLIVHLLHNYKDQGRGYLDAVTELTHVFIRMLERYSKQNTDMQIRSRRRARKRKQEQEPRTVPDDSEAEDVDKMEIVTRERKFDFAKASARFMTQQCVNTFVEFTRFYRDLNHEQLKRAHRFFHRVAFKVELSTYLFRVDIVQLFNNMIRSEQSLDHDLPIYKEWEELVRQIFKRLIKRLEERPALMVEMLFSKIPSTMYYLEYGIEKEVHKGAPRPPAVLEVNSRIEEHHRIGVVTEALVSDTKFELIQFVKDELARAVEERGAWADAEAARKAMARIGVEANGSDTQQTVSIDPPTVLEPDDGTGAPLFFLRPKSSEVKTAMFKNNRLRLLMSLCGMKRMNTSDDVPDASWFIPSTESAETLQTFLKQIQDAETSLATLANYEDAKAPEDYLRRVNNSAAARQQRPEGYLSTDEEGEDDVEEGINDDADEEGLFPDGGPTARKSDAPKKTKKKLQRGKKGSAELSDAEKARRAKKNKANDLERRRKIKSDVWVHDSDEEEDAEKDKEFFRLEEQRRKKGSLNVAEALEAAKKVTSKQIKRKAEEDRSDDERGKRRKSADNLESDEDMPDREGPVEISSNSDSDPEPGSDSDSDSAPIVARDSDNEEAAEETPLSSQARVDSSSEDGEDGVSEKTPAAEIADDISMGGAEEHSSEELRKPSHASRKRGRAGFVIDDSDSE